jgi:ABC-type transport system involved in multi-copper enzyme maturation permease subunit
MKALALLLYTLREAILKGTLVFYFLVSTLVVVVLALAVKVSPENPNEIIAFGRVFNPFGLAASRAVEFLLVQIYNSASSAILLLGLFATAGLLPSLLEKGTAEIFLSKPIGRPTLFAARCAGAVGGVFLNILYFIVGAWTVIGVNTGVWHTGFLVSSLLTAYIFICFFSIPAFFGIVSQSTGLAVMLGFALQLFSGALEMRETVMFRLWDNVVYHRFLDVLYYLTPQLSAMSKNAATLIGTLPRQSASFDIMPFVYSAFSSSLFCAASIRIFMKKDY